MQLRPWLNAHPVWSAVIVIVILLGALGVVYTVIRQPLAPDKEWFYDTGSGQLYKVGKATLAPTTGPSGKEAVKAVVLGCGGCPVKPGKGDIAYVERLTPAGIEMSQHGVPPVEEGAEVTERRRSGVLLRETQIASPSMAEWLVHSSEEGQTLISEAHRKCAERGAVRVCLPG